MSSASAAPTGPDQMYGGRDADSFIATRGPSDVGSVVMLGRGGDDRLIYRGSLLNDVTLNMNGGEGNDRLVVTEAGKALIKGGTGNDDIVVRRSWDGMVDGGEGNDVVRISESFQMSVRLGEGDDTVIVSDSVVQLFLGAGRDRVVLAPGSAQQVPIFSIRDFDTAAGGDIVDLRQLLPAATNVERGADPFASGHLRLIASEVDTLVQIDRDGAGTDFGWETFGRFERLQPGVFTADHFAGNFDPRAAPSIDAAAPAQDLLF